jgi:prepilin-type N-terminal cleavage/methylation domain-containing protein
MEHRLLGKDAMIGSHATKTRTRGFTLVELLVVIGIIAVMAAISLPNISGFIRSNRVRSAQDQVAGAIQKARSRAIALNSQWGVSFIIESPSVYWVHVEDPQPPVAALPAQSGRQPLNSAAFPCGVADAACRARIPALSTRYQLDDSVRFAVAAGSCPLGAAAGNQDSIRFDRYGSRSFPAFVPPAPALPVPPLAAPTGPTVTGILITTNDADANICLVDIRNGLSRMITIARGGRVKKG